MKYTIVIEPELDPDFKGYFNAYVPALPGCQSYGKTLDKAKMNILEALELYLETLSTDKRNT